MKIRFVPCGLTANGGFSQFSERAFIYLIWQFVHSQEDGSFSWPHCFHYRAAVSVQNNISQYYEMFILWKGFIWTVQITEYCNITFVCAQPFIVSSCDTQAQCVTADIPHLRGNNCINVEIIWALKILQRRDRIKIITDQVLCDKLLNY